MHLDIGFGRRTAWLHSRWTAGVAGGFVGGLGMGLVLHLGANIMPYIGALYGWPSVVGGWFAHLTHSVLLGLLFTLLVSRPVVRGRMTSLAACLEAGTVFAAAVGLASSGVMLPLAMTRLGTLSFPEPLLPLPSVVAEPLVVVSIGLAHVVYGLVLGATYWVVHDLPYSEADPGHPASPPESS